MSPSNHLHHLHHLHLIPYLDLWLTPVFEDLNISRLGRLVFLKPRRDGKETRVQRNLRRGRRGCVRPTFLFGSLATWANQKSNIKTSASFPGVERRARGFQGQSRVASSAIPAWSLSPFDSQLVLSKSSLAYDLWWSLCILASEALTKLATWSMTIWRVTTSLPPDTHQRSSLFLLHYRLPGSC